MTMHLVLWYCLRQCNEHRHKELVLKLLFFYAARVGCALRGSGLC